MDILIHVYSWGIIVELLFHLYALIMYSFGFDERKTYQTNLNKVGLSWDPLYLKVYPVSEFTHSTTRFWVITIFDILGCLLSWYQVLYRVHKIMKVRQINSILTTQQKQAAFVLRNDPTLLKDEVIEKLKILEPSILPTEPEDQERNVGYAKSSAACFWCDNAIRPGEIVLYYGEPPAKVPRTSKQAIFHYSCALDLDLHHDGSSSITVYANLKERLEAQVKIKELLLKDSPKLEKRSANPPSIAAVDGLDSNGKVLMLEMADATIFVSLLGRLANKFDGEKEDHRLTKFITDLEGSSLPLSAFMKPVLEKESKNPVALSDLVAALSEEDNHGAAVVEMVREAFYEAAKEYGWDIPIPANNLMTSLDKIDDPVALKTVKATAERALGKADHPLIAALNAKLVTEKNTL